jgi:hypothetical protein
MHHERVIADSPERVADAYARFADEARGRSALYEELARGVARDAELLRVLAELPRDLLAAQPRDPWPSGRFLLSQDGRSVAWTDPHGTSIDWLG